MNANYRERLKDKKRIVIKIGSSSLIHSETGRLDFRKLEILARELSDLHNQGKDVVLVSSGAIAVGAAALGMKGKPAELEKKQACAAVGQARLMTIYLVFIQIIDICLRPRWSFSGNRRFFSNIRDTSIRSTINHRPGEIYPERRKMFLDSRQDIRRRKT